MVVWSLEIADQLGPSLKGGNKAGCSQFSATSVSASVN